MFKYLIIINIFSFIIYFIDKVLAIKKLYRISEISLIIISILGGMVGGLMSMLIFRHKTKKIYFYLINIFSLILWIFILLNRG